MLADHTKSLHTIRRNALLRNDLCHLLRMFQQLGPVFRRRNYAGDFLNLIGGDQEKPSQAIAWTALKRKEPEILDPANMPKRPLAQLPKLLDFCLQPHSSL